MKIHDIFSKKKTKQPKEIKIIVDHREKNSLVISELVDLGIQVELQQLKVADYLVNNVAVERKTVADFVSSMINKRLTKQLIEIGQYKNRLLIVEGIDEQELYTDSKDWTGMHPNAIRGFLLSILINYKVPIIFSKDYKDTAKFLAVLAKRKPKEISLNVNKKSLSKKERLQFILEGFPGIGPKTAKKLLSHFKNLKDLFNASEQELKDLVGKKAEALYKIINDKY
jgi:Fanconi anemia group M protein